MTDVKFLNGQLVSTLRNKAQASDGLRLLPRDWLLLIVT